MYSYLLACILALAAVDWGSSENVTSATLPSPRIYGLSHDYDEGSTIYWQLDDENDDTSILGYKVKLWQVGCDKKAKYEIVDGKRVRLKNVMPKLYDVSTLRNLTEFVVEGAQNSYLKLNDIESDVPYHVTVAAYGAGGAGEPGDDGPPFRFQQIGVYTCREV